MIGGRSTHFISPPQIIMSAPVKDSEGRSTDETAEQLLKRHFSTISAASTSSLASLLSRSTDRPSSPAQSEHLRVIGLGSCGTVFELSGTELVFKKGTKRQSIWQDFSLTNHAHYAAQDVQGTLQNAFPSAVIPQIPFCHRFHEASDESFWTEDRLRQFPCRHQSRQPLLLETQILPLPKSVREALIELYFDDDTTVQQQAKDNQENQDCLVRVYLGERENPEQQAEGYTSLRNFEMRLNMMEDLELDISAIATEMAIGLAMLHWEAKIDAMDTEFVLGRSATWNTGAVQPEEDALPKAEKSVNFRRRDIHLWMLDYDKATAIELTEEDVIQKLVPGFMGNDPYFPMPNVDEELWGVFSAAYLKASATMLRARKASKMVKRLPKKFLEGVVEQVKKNEDWDAGDNVVFGD